MLVSVDLIGRCSLIFISFVFAVRVMHTKTGRSREQIWAVVMMVTTGLSYGPLTNLIQFQTYMFPDQPRMFGLAKHKWFFITLNINRVISLCLSSVGQLFCIWSCAHSYGE